MHIDDLRRIVCVGCGRGDVPLNKLRAAMVSTLRACAACLTRYGDAALAHAADQALAGAVAAPPAPSAILARGLCRHCGEAVVSDPATGGYPLWCSDCERELTRLRGTSIPTS